MRVPVVIDCDPGIDDAIAICLAQSSHNLDIKAITPVAGNVPADYTFKNALDLANYFNIEARIATGATKPLLTPPVVATYVHGEDGLGGYVLPEAQDKKFDTNHAWDVIYQEAVRANGKLCLIAIGPLTNIAICLFKYPDLGRHLKDIVIMGGSVNGGNSSPTAEFNILADPHAADAVFKSGIPIKLFDLNATHQGAITMEEAQSFLDVDNHINDMMRALITYNFEFVRKSGGRGLVIHDAITVAGVIDPSLVEYVQCNVSVETKSALSLGRTVVDNRVNQVDGSSNISVAAKVDKSKYLTLLHDMMSYYS